MLFLLLACTGATQDDTAGDDTASGGPLTLDTCGGSVDDSLGAPWTWFRCATITESGGDVVLYSNGLPPHPSPYYPTDDPNWEAFDSRTGEWHQNPNTIAEQDITVRIPVDPTPKGITITDDLVDRSAGDSTDEYHGATQGISPDGTMFFAGFAAPGDDISEEEYTFDLYEGHPEMTGTYHHHGSNPAAEAVMAANDLSVDFYGVMCDGTVVIGCDELDGTAISGDLDAQNGHLADIADPDGRVLFTERYHIHACDDLGGHLTPEIQYYDDGTCL
jgi:hypothetical protein